MPRTLVLGEGGLSTRPLCGLPPVPDQPDIRVIVIAFHVRSTGCDRMIRRYTYPKGEAISDRTYNGSVGQPLRQPVNAEEEHLAPWQGR